MTAKSETVGVVWPESIRAMAVRLESVSDRATNDLQEIDRAASYMHSIATCLEDSQAEVSRLIGGTIEDTLTIDQLTEKYETLLSGLEALAGELDAATRSPDVTVPQYTRLAGMAAEFRALIPAAANTESEVVK